MEEVWGSKFPEGKTKRIIPYQRNHNMDKLDFKIIMD